MLDQIYQAGRWLNSTDLHTSIRHLLQTVGWVSPTIQSIHIVCITLVIGTSALLDLRILEHFLVVVDRTAGDVGCFKFLKTFS